jgi:VRR-NUC domain-containing protein
VEVKPNEADFQSVVVEVARLAGWRVAHFRPARTDKGWRTPVTADGAGWPDLVLVRPPRIVFAELKSERGKVRPEQTEWLDVLRLLPGTEVYLWRPNDWDALVEVLTGSRPRKAA